MYEKAGKKTVTKKTNVTVDLRAELTEINKRVVDILDDLHKLYDTNKYHDISKILNNGHHCFHAAIQQIHKANNLKIKGD